MLDHFPQRCERRVGNGRALSVAGAAGCAVSDDYFKPRAKIHWRIVGWHADVAEIAGAVTRWIKRATPRFNECGMSSCSTVNVCHGFS
jgi:hypothetical protein